MFPVGDKDCRHRREQCKRHHASRATGEIESASPPPCDRYSNRLHSVCECRCKLLHLGCCGDGRNIADVPRSQTRTPTRITGACWPLSGYESRHPRIDSRSLRIRIPSGDRRQRWAQWAGFRRLPGTRRQTDAGAAESGWGGWRMHTPGGSVIGINGRNAAMAVLKDTGIT
jgi:hypothetical protein